MTEIVDLIVAQLVKDPDALALLAENIGPLLPSSPTGEDGWMDMKTAAVYLGMSAHALRKLAGEGRVPYEQDGRGAKCWFKRSELDAWRRGQTMGAAA